MKRIFGWSLAEPAHTDDEATQLARSEHVELRGRSRCARNGWKCELVQHSLISAAVQGRHKRLLQLAPVFFDDLACPIAIDEVAGDRQESE